MTSGISIRVEQYGADGPELRLPQMILFSAANPDSGIPRMGFEKQMALIFKILDRSEWEAAAATGEYKGSAVDCADGFIHFSTAMQMRETAAKHFAGQTDLVLAAFDDSTLGPKLIYETSRGGALFPHLYGTLETRLAVLVVPLPLNEDGSHLFPGDGV
jgi:uncharacterized protein (DUF952 family)